jgi:hypothetical protein
MMAETQSQALHAEGCLFCRKHDGGFTSEEHIISGRLAGDSSEELLPPGIVCDRCNNGPLARADRELADFEPFKLLRAQKGMGTRKGEAVVSHWKEGSIAFTAPGEMSLYGDRVKPTTVGPNEHRLTLTTKRPVKQVRSIRIMRAIWKAGLEYVYLDHGADKAFEAIFDPVRAEVLENGAGRGWVVVPKQAKLHDEIRTRVWLDDVDGRTVLPISLDIFGVVFVTDPLTPGELTADLRKALPVPANVWRFPEDEEGAPIATT